MNREVWTYKKEWVILKLKKLTSETKTLLDRLIRAVDKITEFKGQSIEYIQSKTNSEYNE